jgi:hypothetical protein
MYEYNVGVQTQLLDNAKNVIKKERKQTVVQPHNVHGRKKKVIWMKNMCSRFWPGVEDC